MDKTKELETRNIGQLLWIYALPAVISQIIASVYNIADRVFIGHGVGPLAIAGLAITMPVMNVVHAFGSLIGVGSSARMSIVLGQKDVRWAEKILGQQHRFHAHPRHAVHYGGLSVHGSDSDEVRGHDAEFRIPLHLIASRD